MRDGAAGEVRYIDRAGRLFEMPIEEDANVEAAAKLTMEQDRSASSLRD